MSAVLAGGPPSFLPLQLLSMHRVLEIPPPESPRDCLTSAHTNFPGEASPPATVSTLSLLNCNNISSAGVPASNLVPLQSILPHLQECLSHPSSTPPCQFSLHTNSLMCGKADSLDQGAASLLSPHLGSAQCASCFAGLPGVLWRHWHGLSILSHSNPLPGVPSVTKTVWSVRCCLTSLPLPPLRSLRS